MALHRVRTELHLNTLLLFLLALISGGTSWLFCRWMDKIDNRVTTLEQVQQQKSELIATFQVKLDGLVGLVEKLDRKTDILIQQGRDEARHR